MPRTEEIAVSDLMLDPENARLGTVQTSQPATALALAKQQGRRLINIAADILDDGLDPGQPPTVIATGKGDRRRRYTVLEGNRRILAIKAMETPSLVAGALKPADLKKLQGLALKFKANPIETVTCVMYEDSESAVAYRRVMRRHNGAQDGVGLVEWDSNEKDRFAARHGGGKGRSTAGQVLDFIDTVDGPHASQTKIITTLDRIMGSPEIKEALGLQKIDGELVSWYPKDEVAKGVRKIVDDLRSQKIKVTDVYHAPERRQYLTEFKRTQLPKKSTRLKDPVKLSDLAKGKSTPVKTTAKKAARPKPKTQRTAVAASDAKINPAPPRLNQIFNELVSLSADNYANAGSVLLRVFLELSVDDYIVREKVMTATEMGNAGLAKRMKAVAAHLEKAGHISIDLKKAVNKVADSQHTLAASVTAFHQYVHNQYVYPKPSELRMSWDEIQPFLEAIWR